MYTAAALKEPRPDFRLSPGLVIFDLDGTLIDSREDIADCVNSALSAFGLPTWSVDDVTSFIGQGTRTLIERALAGREEILDPVFKTFTDLYRRDLLRKTRLYPGVLETLDALAPRALAVLSNKRQEFCDAILLGLGVRPWFGQVLGGDALSWKKPHPEPIRHICRKLGANPFETTMVGEGSADVLAGKAAGAFTVALTDGFGSPWELESLGPDMLLPDMASLRGFA